MQISVAFSFWTLWTNAMKSFRIFPVTDCAFEFSARRFEAHSSGIEVLQFLRSCSLDILYNPEALI